MICSGWQSICHSDGDVLLILPGRIGYEEGMKLQDELLEGRIKGVLPDTLILLEHDEAITIGRSGSEEDILVSREMLREMGIGLYFVNRGGKATYHGPGQIVGYPIMDISRFGSDIRRYVGMIEDFIILFLEGMGIEGRRIDGNIGVWVGDEKIASIGIGVKRWISFHGFSLNVDPDLSRFDLIRPCGMEGVRMTSISKLIGRGVSVWECIGGLRKAFEDVFGVRLREWRSSL
jgi:lipoate-protein ligase B